MLAVVLGANLHSRGFWLRSHLNPADDPTRDAPLRTASARLPAWWDGALAGDFRLLGQVVAHHLELDPPPSLDELVPPDVIAPQDMVQISRRRRCRPKKEWNS